MLILNYDSNFRISIENGQIYTEKIKCNVISDEPFSKPWMQIQLYY